MLIAVGLLFWAASALIRRQRTAAVATACGALSEHFQEPVGQRLEDAVATLEA